MCMGDSVNRVDSACSVYELTFDGAFMARGFWLYVWEITTEKDVLYYVGRTGDSSSSKAQSPFNRMGQHLGSNEKNNVLRRHLKNKNIDPETCRFRLVTYGPILEEAVTQSEHRVRRDTIAAQERALTEAMVEVGYSVINRVRCRKPLDARVFDRVKAVFATHFPKLRRHVAEIRTTAI